MKFATNKRSALVLLVFIILGFLIYSNTLDVPFYFDDRPNIVENPYVRLTDLTSKNIACATFKSPLSNRPVANLSFALNYYFHQYNVAGYHAINIVIHIITGILLYFFIKTTLSIPSLRSRYKHHASIAFFAALIWLVHPIQTQSVTYIVQRMNSMAAMFYILSFLLYVKGRLVKENQKAWPWFAGCALAGLLALGSKEISATLPFFILLYEWYFLQDLSKAWLKRSIPYFMGAFVVFGLLVLLYLGSNPLEHILSGYEHRDFTLTQRVLTQFRVVTYYISLLVYPSPARLNLAHDFSLSCSFIDPVTTSLSLVSIMALIALAVLIAKKERLISFGILWFFGNLLIESSVIALEIIFEHRLYLPSMFVCLMAVTLAYQCKIPDWLKAGLLCSVIAVFSFWTYERNHVWIDEVTLWKDCAQKSKEKARPHNNLGNALFRQGKLDEAIAHYYEVIRIKPNHFLAHNNLGVALGQQGSFEKSISHFYKALQIKPDYADAHNNLGLVLTRQGKVNEAIAHFYKALQIKPDYAKAHYNLGMAYSSKGLSDRAFKEIKRARALSSKDEWNLMLKVMKAKTKAQQAAPKP